MHKNKRGQQRACINDEWNEPGPRMSPMKLVEPLTLANMRANGVRSLAITCGALRCHHRGVLDVSPYPDDVAVPSFGPRMVCTVCGAIGAEARTNWQERPQFVWRALEAASKHVLFNTQDVRWLVICRAVA
jgi:hypothetical protein